MSDSSDQSRSGHPVNRRRALPQPDPALIQGVEVVVEPVALEAGIDVVHEWGLASFPASDPPANW